MKVRLGVAGVMLLLFLVACTGGGQAGMPTGDHVHGLGVSGEGDLLLGLHGGLYRSDDGSGWELVGLRGEDAMVIAAGGQPMFIAGHEVLYRSDDDGATFSALNPADLPGLDIHGFAQEPTNGETVYAYVVGHGLYASEDAGRSWELRAPLDSLPSDGFGIAAVGSEGETLLMVGPESGVLRSDDGGRSFERVFDAPAGAVAVEGGSPDTAWALTAAGLTRSDDGGQTWKVLSLLRGVEGQPVTLAADQGGVWVVTEQPRALYHSGDDGASWDRVDRP